MAKSTFYTFQRQGDTGWTVTRASDGRELGIANQVERVGGGTLWQAYPVGHELADGRMTHHSNRKRCAQYLDALARAEAAVYTSGQSVRYCTVEGWVRTARLDADGLRFGSVRVVERPYRVGIRQVALALMLEVRREQND